MSVSTVNNTPSQSRIQALREKHQTLSQKVDDVYKHPSASDFYLNQLKKQKLILKEKIEEAERKAVIQLAFRFKKDRIVISGLLNLCHIVL